MSPLPNTQTLPAWLPETLFLDVDGRLVKNTAMTVVQSGTSVLAEIFDADGTASDNPLPTSPQLTPGKAGGADQNGNVQFGAAAGLYDILAGATYIGTVELTARDGDLLHTHGDETKHGALTITAVGSDALLALNASPSNEAELRWQDEGVNKWGFYKWNDSSTPLGLWDYVNSRNHLILTPGATSTAAMADFYSNVQVRGYLNLDDADPAGTLRFLNSGTSGFLVYYSGALHIHDDINGRDQIIVTAGASDALALTEFHSRVQADGTILANAAVPIKLPTGTASQVLTSDASGNLTLQPGAGALTVLGASNGTDDTTWINAILAAAGVGAYVRGTPGQTYKISAPLVTRPGGQMTLDMTGCTIQFATTAVRTNMLNNAAVAPSNTATDLATTAGSNVVTSAALVAAGAAVGHSVGVVAAGVLGGGTGGPPRVWLYGKITAIAGNNITLGGNFNPTQADVTLAGATGYLFKTRDGNVTVIGGTWDVGTNWNVSADRYSAAYNSNLLRFRRCDGLTVRDVKLSIDIGYASSGSGWCFGINPADCTAVLIENPKNVPGQAAPTFVNSSGLVGGCIVRNVEGTSYDDMVAFGCVGAGGDDVEGDIGDLLIDGVFSRIGGPAAWNKGSNRGVDLYCGKGGNGQQRVLWTFDVRSVKGTYNNWPVSLVSYPSVAGQGANFSGRLGDISGVASGKPSIFIGRADGTNAGLNTGLDVTGTVTGPDAGADLVAPAQITANSAATGPAIADVAGLSITFTAPPSGAVWLEAWAYSVGQIGAAGNTIVYITDSANNVVAQSFMGNLAAGGFSTSPNPKRRVTGLVSGTSYTYKVRLSSAAGTQQFLAGATYPAFLSAKAA